LINGSEAQVRCEKHKACASFLYDFFTDLIVVIWREED